MVRCNFWSLQFEGATFALFVKKQVPLLWQGRRGAKGYKRPFYAVSWVTFLLFGDGKTFIKLLTVATLVIYALDTFSGKKSV